MRLSIARPLIDGRHRGGCGRGWRLRSAEQILHRQSPTNALAFNTLGGVAGGVLEYASVMLGIRALNWLAIAAYALAVALLLLKRRSRAAAVAVA